MELLITNGQLKKIKLTVLLLVQLMLLEGKLVKNIMFMENHFLILVFMIVVAQY